MKITFVTPFFYPVMGGAENHVFYLAQELIKKGHEVEVFTSDLDRKGKIKESEETHQGIKIRRFKTWFRIGDFGSFFPGIFKAIKESDSDIIHMHCYRHPFNSAAFSTKKPVILTPHYPNYPKELRKKYINLLIALFDRLIGKPVLKRCNKILVITEIEREWLKEKFHVPQEKIILLPNGIPHSYLKKRNPATFKKKFNLSNKPIILCLSRLHKSKGFDRVVMAAGNFPQARFVLAGIDGGFRAELETLVKQLNLSNVSFTGELTEEEKLQAYAAATIFIHPSHFEGFGIVVLEAFSQETCVLSSNKGGLPWVVGDAGLTFEDNNLNDLKEKINLLLKDKKLREKLAIKGRKRVEQFTWEKLGAQLEEIYKKTMQNSQNLDDAVIGKGNMFGKAVFANRDFKKGEVVINYNLKPLTEKEFKNLSEYEKNFTHKHWGITYLYSEPERYVAHSQNPNTKQDLKAQCDIAVKDIKKGDEITTDATKDDV